MNEYANTDGLVPFRMVTRNGVTWAIGIDPYDGQGYAAYADQSHMLTYGEIARIAPTLTDLINSL